MSSAEPQVSIERQTPAETASPPRRYWALPAGGLILLAALAAYHNSFAGPFILDDPRSIERNPTIRHLWPIWRPLCPPGGVQTTAGRPVLNLTLAINYAISGLDVWSYHVLNLVIHAVAGLALFGVVRRTLLLPEMRDRFGRAATFLALAAGLIWTVHPLQTESVTYVVQRAESIVGLFYLLTLYCVIRGACASKPAGWYVAAAAACVAGMASKETMASAPLIVLLYDRTFLAGSFKAALRARRRLYIALAASWGLLAWLVISSGTRGSSAGFGSGMDPFLYAMHQFGWIGHYLQVSLWPDRLFLVLDNTLELGPPPWWVWPCMALVLGLLAATIRAVWRGKKVGFLGAFFFAVLAPSSSIVPISQVAAEHRMYLALAAVVVLAVMSAHRLWVHLMSRAPRARSLMLCAAPALLIVIAAALGYRTVLRNHDYRSDVAIWAAAVRHHPSARAYNALGLALARKGRTDAAIRRYRQALAMNPRDPAAHYNLGLALVRKGRLDEAIGHYRQSLRSSPYQDFVHNSLGLALVEQNKPAEAIEHFRLAVRINPGHAQAHHSLAFALAGRGDLDEAIEHYQASLRIDPYFPGAHSNLADALKRRGRLAEAIEHYRQALRAEPDSPGIHNNLGGVLILHGRTPEAIEHLQRAISIDPNCLGAYMNLGIAFSKQGELDAAVEQLRHALAVKPDLLVAHWQLGMWLMAQRKLDEAVEHFRQALRLRSDHVGTCNNLAWLLATHPSLARGDPGEAVELAERACRLTEQRHLGCLDTLAAAYAAAGRFKDAVATARKAIELAEASGEARQAKEIQARLELYRAGKPYLEEAPSEQPVEP